MPRIAALFATLAPGAPAVAQCEVLHLLPESDPTPHYFGNAVGLHGSLAVVGAEWEDSAYLFDLSDGSERFALVPDDVQSNSRFGFSVAVDGALAVVGAPSVDGYFGAAYVFDVRTGAQLHKLVSPTLNPERAGIGAAIGGDTVVVGAPNHAWMGPGSGAAHLFSASTGQFRARLLAYDGGPDDRFGDVVATDGGRVIVGAPFHGDHFGTASGAAYVFDAHTGEPLLELLPTVGAVGARFGGSVALDGDRAVVGTTGTSAPGAYLFDLVTGQELFHWEVELEQFGASVGIEDDTVLVGAPVNDLADTNAGAVYRFDAVSGALVGVITASAPQPYARVSNGGIAMSAGRALIATEYFEDPNGVAVGTAYLFSVERDFGEAYCPPSVPNSRGLLGRVTPEGCDTVLANDLRLRADLLPRNRFGYFLASPNQGFLPGVGGGQGNLCLGGNLARFVAQAGSSGPNGELTVDVDLDAVPASPVESIVVGSTWNFQCWYRDQNPGDTSNLTEGRSILFR